MKKETVQRIVTKPGIKSTASTKHSRVNGKKGAQVKRAVGSKNGFTKPTAASRQEKSKPDFLISHNSVDNRNVLIIIDAVRTGIAFKDFENIISRTPFSLPEWANYLKISERTIQRNQKERKAFQPLQSERIIELAMLYDYGVEVFEKRDHFNVWLNTTSPVLGGRLPKELLDTKFGIGLVRDELGRIEHGVLA
jgi:putative toxin-antitoxin system antitoxin component (TIGR02293 family)